MTKIETIKAAVTPTDAARQYGLAVGNHGMTCCPYHDDRHPSMKLYDDHSVVSEHNADFARLAENAKAVRRLDTALKHIDTAISLKPIFDESKKGFDRRKEKYAAEHKEELEQFKKAVRYLKANGLNTDDCDRCSAERNALIRENEQLERKLRSVNLDPDMVAQIKYRIGKVLDSGETPQHEVTLQERLKQPIPAEQPQKTNTKNLRLQEELE